MKETARPAGIIVGASIQVMVGSVFLFTGSLIRGGVALFSSALFGTWMITSGVYLVAMALAAGRPSIGGRQT
jgi:hypothetical protein